MSAAGWICRAGRPNKPAKTQRPGAEILPRRGAFHSDRPEKSCSITASMRSLMDSSSAVTA